MFIGSRAIVAGRLPGGMALWSESAVVTVMSRLLQSLPAIRHE